MIGPVTGVLCSLIKSANIFGRSRKYLHVRGITRGISSSQVYLGSPFQQDIKTERLQQEMELKSIVERLDKFAPPCMAEGWDNVGLLVEPTSPHLVTNIILTIDLVHPVLQEAKEKTAGLIISYHPPIFAAIKRLTQSSWKEKIIVECIENRMAVYSPHTCYDVLEGGLNDWLLSPFDTSAIEPINHIIADCHLTLGQYRVDTRIPSNKIHQFMQDLETHQSEGIEITDSSSLNSSGPDLRLRLNCSKKALPKLLQATSKYEGCQNNTEIVELAKPPVPNHGPGRLAYLKEQVTITSAITAVKEHLNLKYVRIALGLGKSLDSSIQKVAVCAGSGSSVLKGIKADLYLTGEMSHHEVLDANANGITVILCDHTNTERGFLKVLKDKLNVILEGKVNIFVSQVDRDPLEVM